MWELWETFNFLAPVIAVMLYRCVLVMHLFPMPHLFSVVFFSGTVQVIKKLPTGIGDILCVQPFLGLLTTFFDSSVELTDQLLNCSSYNYQLAMWNILAEILCMQPFPGIFPAPSANQLTTLSDNWQLSGADQPSLNLILREGVKHWGQQTTDSCSLWVAWRQL